MRAIISAILGLAATAGVACASETVQVARRGATTTEVVGTHRVVHRRTVTRRVVTRSVAHRDHARRGATIDARTENLGRQWEVEVVPGRTLLPRDNAIFLPSPGQPAYDDRVSVTMGAGGTVTPPLFLPLHRGFNTGR